MSRNIQFILMDIEGTTTDIDFVHRVLFPYSAEHLESFVESQAQNPDVQAALAEVQKTVLAEEGLVIDGRQTIDTLLKWIREDRKHTALKKLQGMIWRIGVENGDYQGHVYEDVPLALERWKQSGLGLGIYSSGSVQAQTLLFQYSIAGDLTPYFSHYFDTAVGMKRDTLSYQKIAAKLQLNPADILFLSDVEAELEAASQAGLQVTQLVRPGTAPSQRFPTALNFETIGYAFAY